MRQGEDVPGAFFWFGLPLVWKTGLGGWLPGLMGHGVGAVDGEDVGLVGVVLCIRVVGADPDFLFGRQVVDLNGLGGKGVGAGVEHHGRPGRMEGCQVAEGSQPGPGVGAAVGADEVVLEAAGHGAELGGGGGVGDDATSGSRSGGLGMRRLGHRLVRRRSGRSGRSRRWSRRWSRRRVGRLVPRLVRRCGGARRVGRRA